MDEIDYEDGDVYQERDLYSEVTDDTIDIEEDGFMQGYNE